MSATRLCDQCGKPLPPRAPGGLCPVCLLAQALEPPASHEDPAVGQAAATPITHALPLATPARFGDYELLAKIAEGGMGVVYRARQLSLNRIVAVKLIQPGRVDSPEMVLRFRAEAEAAASLHHPHIVTIHETGECAGQHYFSMDYIEGRNLTEAVREGPLPSTRTAQIVRQIADAVHFAHQHNVLHRDLKPSNVILDEAGEPHVMDFGLARRLVGDSSLTLTGQVFGSPRFMPPEQASGRRGAVSVRSDVYGLGAILYYLLTARPPFIGETVETTLAQVLGQEPVAPRLLNASVPRDLETICLKCLEKEPSRRYATAQAVADELGRFLEKKPILARPVSRPERVWRWCRRSPVRASLIVALVLVTAVGAAGVLWQWREAVRAQSRAEQERYDALINDAQAHIQQTKFDRAREILARKDHENQRGWEWGWLQRQCNLDLMSFPHATPRAVAFSPDGRTVASGGWNRTVILWDLESGTGKRSLTGHTTVIWSLAFSPDGRRIASASGDGMRVWDVITGQPLLTLTNIGVSDVAFSPDGRVIALASIYGGARLCDAETGARLSQRLDHEQSVCSVAFSPDGRRLACAGGRWLMGKDLDTTVSVFDWTNQQHLLHFKAHRQTIQRVRFSPDGNLLATTSTDGTARLWNAQTGELVRPLEAGRPGQNLLDLDFSPDGRWLVIGTLGWAAGQAHIFEVATGRRVRSLQGHSMGVPAVKFGPDGTRLVTAGFDSTIRVWPTARVPEFLSLEGHEQAVRTVAFSPKGKRIASGSFDQTAGIWDAQSGERVTTLPVGFPVVSLAFSPDGERVVTVAPAHSAKVWSATNGQELFTLTGHTGVVTTVAWSADGHLILTSGQDGTARLWDANTGTPLRTVAAHTSRVHSVTFSPDGRRFATGCNDGTARIWDTRTGHRLRELLDHKRPVWQVAFSPDGSQIATGCDDHKVRLFEVKSGRLLFTMEGHRLGISSLVFSPDGSRLAAAGAGPHVRVIGGAERTVMLWDTRTGQRLLSLDAHQNWVIGVAFSPDGQCLATSSGDNTVRIWEVFPWNPEEYPSGSKASFTGQGEAFNPKYWWINWPVETFKRKHWQEHLQAASRTEPLGKTAVQPGRRLEPYYDGIFELNLSAQRGTKLKPALPIPPRDGQTHSNCVDLTHRYNTAFLETLRPTYDLREVEWNLARVPTGFRTLADVPFDVRGIILLSRDAWGCDELPERVEIPLGRKFRRMHVLHGTAALAREGERVGSYRLHYRQGDPAELPILYGRDARDVWAYSVAGSDMDQGPAEVSEAKLVLVSAAKRGNPSERGIRLYRRTYENPCREREVASITFESAMTTSGPFLLALTVEP